MFKPINTFDDAVAYYESIKPVVSTKYTAENDVRPLGSRSRPHERIVKIDANTYALTEGAYGWWSSKAAQNDVLAVTAPILWKREVDGDYVYIRNTPQGCSWPTRWLLLATYLPTQMRFLTFQQPPHRQAVYVNGQTYWLPGMRLVRRKDEASGNQTLCHAVDMSLVFKVGAEGAFERVGTIDVSTGKVDRVRKKGMKPALDAFYEYMLTMAPFINGKTGYEHLTSLSNHVQSRLGVDMPQGSGWVAPTVLLSADGVTINFMTDMLTAPVEDEGKLLFACAVLYTLSYSSVEDDKSLKEFRKRYNAWCTKAFDLYLRETV